MSPAAREASRRALAVMPNSAELSPVPQHTEPDHFPVSALAPAPRRPVAAIRSVEQEWPWLRYAYALGFLLAIFFSALADYLS